MAVSEETKIVIVDYGLCNIFSVVKAFDAINAKAILTDKADLIEDADGLVLPGVGAFGSGMENLKRRGLFNAIKEHAAKDRPLLGICLGMQMMMSESEEFGIHSGLDLIKGRVVRLTLPENKSIAAYKIPNIGWRELLVPNNRAQGYWDGTILENLQANRFAYFVHSYMAVLESSSNILANTNYAGYSICAAIRRGNIFGTQFHPEKSGEAGLTMLKNFVNIVKTKKG